jgi:hypothetical protein
MNTLITLITVLASIGIAFCIMYLLIVLVAIFGKL